MNSPPDIPKRGPFRQCGGAGGLVRRPAAEPGGGVRHLGQVRYPQSYFEREYKGQDLRVVLSPLTDDFVVGKYRSAAAMHCASA